MNASGFPTAGLSSERDVVEDTRIVAVEPLVLTAPPEQGLESWQQGWTSTVLVRVRTRAGAQGFGIAESQPAVVEAVVNARPHVSFSDEAGATYAGLASLVLGASAVDLGPVWQRMYDGSLLYGRRGVVLQAMSAIDVACTDAVARYLGISVSHLLGGRFRDTVPAYASAVLPDEQEGARSLARHVAETGFPALKVGWGAFRLETDVFLSLLHQIRAELPASVRLIFDVGFERPRTAKEVLQLIRALEQYDPLWIEEPCHPDDLGSYRTIVRGTQVPIAAGEACATVHDFAQLIDAGVDVIQPDLARCGGFTVARQVAERCAAANRLTIPHAWQNDLLLAATAHFCATLPRSTFVEYSVARGPLREICEPPLRLAGGSVRVPDRPGLGVAPSEEILERFRSQ